MDSPRDLNREIDWRRALRSQQLDACVEVAVVNS